MSRRTQSQVVVFVPQPHSSSLPFFLAPRLSQTFGLSIELIQVPLNTYVILEYISSSANATQLHRPLSKNHHPYRNAFVTSSQCAFLKHLIWLFGRGILDRHQKCFDVSRSPIQWHPTTQSKFFRKVFLRGKKKEQVLNICFCFPIWRDFRARNSGNFITAKMALGWVWSGITFITGKVWNLAYK